MNPDDGTPVPRPSSPPVREQPSSPPVREQAAADKDAISTPERQAVSTTIPVDRSVDLETAAQTYEQRAEDIETNNAGKQRGILYAICLLNICVNLDGGSLPATLSEVKAEFDLTYSEVGALGGLVFFGVSLFAPIAGTLLTRYKSQRVVILGAVIGNATSVFWFAIAPSRFHLFMARFMMGITQASILVYSPVWVDDFAPPESITLWMSVMQAAVAIGIMLGYIMGGVMVVTLGPDYWRLSIGVQAGLLSLFIPIYALASSHNVNAVGGREQRVLNIVAALKKEDGVHVEAEVEEDVSVALNSPEKLELEVEESFCAQLCQLVSNKMYVVLTLALSGLYFVVTGIQFWVTDYLTAAPELGGLGADKGTVLVAFSVTILTAPTAGVIFGGWYVDKLGGYKDVDGSGEAVVTTLRACALFGFGSCCGGLPAAFIPNLWGVIGCIWVVLFFGGALLPPATGVCINIVSPELRSLSSAISVCAYNALGYSAAPPVCGLIADAVGLKWGFRTLMLSCGTALITLGTAYLMAKAKASRIAAGTEPTPAAEGQRPVLKKKDSASILAMGVVGGSSKTLVGPIGFNDAARDPIQLIEPTGSNPDAESPKPQQKKQRAMTPPLVGKRVATAQP